MHCSPTTSRERKYEDLGTPPSHIFVNDGRPGRIESENSNINHFIGQTNHEVISGEEVAFVPTVSGVFSFLQDAIAVALEANVFGDSG